MTTVSEVVLAAIRAESGADVNIDDIALVHMDSLGRVSVAIEIMDTYDNIELVADAAYNDASTVAELVAAVEQAVARAAADKA
jgi:acyl carrier protein